MEDKKNNNSTWIFKPTLLFNWTTVDLVLSFSYPSWIHIFYQMVGNLWQSLILKISIECIYSFWGDRFPQFCLLLIENKWNSFLSYVFKIVLEQLFWTTIPVKYLLCTTGLVSSMQFNSGSIWCARVKLYHCTQVHVSKYHCQIVSALHLSLTARGFLNTFVKFPSKPFLKYVREQPHSLW